MLKKSRWLNMVINLEIKENLVHKSIQFPLLTGRLNQPLKNIYTETTINYTEKISVSTSLFWLFAKKR